MAKTARMRPCNRPSPAQLQAAATAVASSNNEAFAELPSASSSSASSSTSTLNAGSSRNEALARLIEMVSAANVNGVSKYPIEKHAGPMFIHEKQNTFCGICGMCITLEDEQAVSRSVNPYTTSGPGTVQHADAGNEEFESLQEAEDDHECNLAHERKFGVMPKPGWTGLYRVVVCEKKKKVESYYVSGVGRYHLWDSDPKARKMYNNCRYSAGEPIFTIPTNNAEALVDRQHFYTKQLSKVAKKSTISKPLVKRASVYPAHFHDDSNQALFPHGFPVHDNCWKMAASVIGADKLEKNLGSFLAVLQQRWDNNGIAVAESRQIADWIVNERGVHWRSQWYQNVGTLMTGCDQYDVNRILIAMHDPIHSDEVQEMIAESARRYNAAKEKQMEADDDDETLSAASGETGTSFTAVSVPGSTDLYAVPSDDVMQIIGELDYSAVETFLEGAKLRIPSSYWRNRAPRHIIWELNDINDQTTPLDWQYLCLRAERLCVESLGLMNRQRIFNILSEVDEAMDKAMDDAMV